MSEQPRTVVLADDEEDYRFVMRRSLERDGRFEVVAEAGTSEEVLATVTEHQPKAVLLDLGLSGPDDDALIGRLLVAAPHSMIAIMTGRSAEERESATRAAGAFTYYEKGMAGRDVLEYLEADCALFDRAISGEDVVAPSAISRRAGRSR